MSAAYTFHEVLSPADDAAERGETAPWLYARIAARQHASTVMQVLHKSLPLPKEKLHLKRIRRSPSGDLDVLLCAASTTSVTVRVDHDCGTEIFLRYQVRARGRKPSPPFSVLA